MLGLEPGASPEELRGAYLDLARVWHPDRFQHDDRLRAKAEQTLQRINEAHAFLVAAGPRNVTPSLSVRLSRSFRAVLRPDGPAGQRTSMLVLGLNAVRGARRSGRGGLLLALGSIAIAAVLVFVVWRSGR